MYREFPSKFNALTLTPLSRSANDTARFEQRDTIAINLRRCEAKIPPISLIRRVNFGEIVLFVCSRSYFTDKQLRDVDSLGKNFDSLRK